MTGFVSSLDIDLTLFVNVLFIMELQMYLGKPFQEANLRMLDSSAESLLSSQILFALVTRLLIHEVL